MALGKRLVAHIGTAVLLVAVVFAVTAFLEFVVWAPMSARAASTLHIVRGILVAVAVLVAFIPPLLGKTEQAERSQRFLGAILDQLPVGVFIVNRHGTPVMANKTSGRLLGRGIVHSIRTEQLTEAYRVYKEGTATPYPAEELPVARVLAGEPIVNVEDIEVERPDGTRVPLHVTATPLSTTKAQPDAKIRNPDYVVAVSQDIRERRRAEAKLARFAAMIRSSEDAIISFDRSAKIDSWNTGAEKLFGYKASEVVGKDRSVITGEQEKPGVPSIIELTLSGRKLPTVETMRYAKNGEERPVSLTVSPIIDRYGAITGASVIFRDLRASKSAEEERKRRQQLEAEAHAHRELASSRTAFLNTAAHELHTPVTPMALRIDMLRTLVKRGETEDLQKHLDSLGSNFDRLRRLIHQILDVVKLEGAGPVAAPQSIKPLDVVNEAVDAIEPMLEARAISVDVNDETSSTAAAFVDEDQLCLMLQNILHNAVKASPPSSSIHVRIKEERDALRITVRDEGHGFDPKNAERIYDAFYQDPEHADVGEPSWGLGLYVTRMLAERNDAQIGCHSDGHGKGATFWIILPKATVQAANEVESVVAS